LRACILTLSLEIWRCFW